MFNQSLQAQFEQADSGKLLIWLLANDKIDPSSLYFGQFIFAKLTALTEASNATETAQGNDLITLLSAFTVEMMLSQHACIDLNNNVFEPWLAIYQSETGDTISITDHQNWWSVIQSNTHVIEIWPEHLESDSKPNSEPEACPLVLWQNRLYLRRYFKAELQTASRIANALIRRDAANALSEARKNDVQQFIDGLFNHSVETNADELSPSQEVDWQKRAVEGALNANFSVISGGPGTGKTTTVMKLLAAMIYQQQALDGQFKLNRRLKIGLAAPTGKAALRLENSIVEELESLALDPDVKKWIPTKASTIHRLMGARGNNEYAFGPRNRLPFDVLLIDEASMVDLLLMTKLFAALKDTCRIVLIGDRKQLSSVEAGNVLADFYQAQRRLTTEYVFELKKSWRYPDDSAIGRLAKAFNVGDFRAIEPIFNEPNFSNELKWHQQADFGLDLIVELVVEQFVKLTQQIKQVTVANEKSVVLTAFDTLRQLQVLCCIKQSDFGVHAINHRVYKRLCQKGIVPNNELHYVGRPVMIEANAYPLNLYNGDIGLQLIDPESGLLMTYFELGESDFVKYHCQRLPSHDSVYAMTVHKSQGSAFSHTVLVLPSEQNVSGSLTRELVYTGLTRSRKQFTLVASKATLYQALKQTVKRNSGLADMLISQLNHV